MKQNDLKSSRVSAKVSAIFLFQGKAVVKLISITVNFIIDGGNFVKMLCSDITMSHKSLQAV